jgi:hypothetical protein
MNLLKEIIRFKKSFLKAILVATILLAISAYYNNERFEDITDDLGCDDDDYFTGDDLIEIMDNTKNKISVLDTLSKTNLDISFVETHK